MKRSLPVDQRRKSGGVDASQLHLLLRLHVSQDQTQDGIMETARPAGRRGAERRGGPLQDHQQVQETGQDRLDTHRERNEQAVQPQASEVKSWF